MSFARWLPVVGLFAVLALVPGALAHHCFSEEETQSGGFTTQSVGPPPSPLAVVAYVLIPLVGVLAALAIAIPSMRAPPPVADR